MFYFQWFKKIARLKICASVLSSSVCSSRFSDEKTTNELVAKATTTNEKTTNELVAKATTTNEKTTNELVAKATTTNDNYYERKDYERISC